MGSEEYSNLRYADDTVLIAETIKELQQELVNEVKERSLAKGLRMKTMVIRRNEKYTLVWMERSWSKLRRLDMVCTTCRAE